MKHQRIAVGLILIITLISILMYSSLEINNYDPDIKYIIKNFEDFNNTRISFRGFIEKVDSTNKTLIISTPQITYNMEIKIDTVFDTIQKGNIVEILGVLKKNDQVDAVKILVIEKWKSDLIIFRSLPAIPFALYLFFRKWHFNSKNFRFERRID